MLLVAHCVNSNIIMAIGTGDKKALVKVLVIHL